MRPINSVMVGFAVIVGALIANPFNLSLKNLVLGFLTGFLISSYSMVINDYYDFEVDKVNNPNRPFPRGKVSRIEGIAFGMVLLILGILSSLLISVETLILASLFALLAWLYNWKVKKFGLFGNSIVSLSVAIPYIYGGIAVNTFDNKLLWFLALTSFLASMGREVIKGINDVKGDTLRNINSIARVKGERFASRLGISFFLLAILSTSFPLIFNLVGIVFLVMVMIPNLLFIYLSLSIFRDFSVNNTKRVKNLALLGMALGLLAFIIGGLVK